MGSEERDPTRERRIVVAAALATLSIVAGPAVAGTFGIGARFVRVEEPALTGGAQRVLEEVPGAYEIDGLVVVPAERDSTRDWDELPRPGRLDGPLVALDVHGLVEYAALPVDGDAPIWLSTLNAGDRVYSDVGPLYHACTRTPDVRGCSDTLLMERDGRLLVHRADLPLGRVGEAPVRLRAIDPSGPVQLLLGNAPVTAAAVVVHLAGHDARTLWATTHRVEHGAARTLWWVTAAAPVVSVRFLDERGRDIGGADLLSGRASPVVGGDA